MGARKLAIVNVWLVGCVPGVRALSPVGACSDTLNQLAAGFDDALRSLLAGLPRRLPGLVYSHADSYGIMATVFADPRTLGYTDVAAACCGSGQAPCLPNSTLCADRDGATSMCSGTARTLRNGLLFSRPRRSTMGRLSTPLPLTSCNWPSPISETRGGF